MRSTVGFGYVVQKGLTMFLKGTGPVRKLQTSSLHQRLQSRPYANGCLSRGFIPTVIVSQMVEARSNLKLRSESLKVFWVQNITSSKIH